MLSTEPGLKEPFFRAALSKDYPQHLTDTILNNNAITEQCLLEMGKRGSSNKLVDLIVTQLNQLEMLLQYIDRVDLSKVREMREANIDQLTNGMLEVMRHDVQSAC